MYYLQSRYYNNEWQRWISADNAFNGNLFCYCNNAATTMFDTNGHAPRISYDGDAAAEFAVSNCYNMSSDEMTDRFYYENGNNCARFVSACVYAGLGDNELPGWYDHNYIEKNRVKGPWRLAKQQYYFFKKSEYALGTYDLDSDHLVAFIKNYNPQPGDLLYKEYYKRGKMKWHAAIITRVTEDMIYYTANTDDVINEPITTMWNEGKKIKVHLIKMNSIQRELQ